MKIVFRPAAIEDLDNILLHIAQDDASAAIRVVDEFETFCLETLADNPLIGASKGEVVQGLRFFPISSYLICHFVADDHIEIARIVHGSQNYQILLKFAYASPIINFPANLTLPRRNKRFRASRCS